jgi:hypothetical protein
MHFPLLARLKVFVVEFDHQILEVFAPGLEVERQIFFHVAHEPVAFVRNLFFFSFDSVPQLEQRVLTIELLRRHRVLVTGRAPATQRYLDRDPFDVHSHFETL